VAKGKYQVPFAMKSKDKKEDSFADSSPHGYKVIGIEFPDF
jgi:hypothetical protein